MENTDLTKAVLDLLINCYEGPQQVGSWITDNNPKAGLFGTLENISAEMASKKISAQRATIAAHVEHLRYHLSLVHRAFMGENSFETANWHEAWTKQTVNDEEWKQRLQQLKEGYNNVCNDIGSAAAWKNDQVFLTGTLAVPAHAAYHLGAIRQIIGFLNATTTKSFL